MKKIQFFFVTLLVIFSLSIPAFAADGDSTGESNTDVIVPDVTIINEIDTGEDLGEYVGTSVYALNPVTSSNTSGLKSVLLDFVGDWDSIVVEHAYESSNGYTNYVREIQLDYPWLCACGLLVVVIYCLFKLGGALLCRK